MNDVTKHETTAKIRQVMAETGYTPHQMARYLGVPTNTCGNWIRDDREMPLAAEKLLDVLTTLRTLVPDIHAYFTPPPSPPDRRKREHRDPNAPPRQRKQRGRVSS